MLTWMLWLFKSTWFFTTPKRVSIQVSLGGADVLLVTSHFLGQLYDIVQDWSLTHFYIYTLHRPVYVKQYDISSRKPLNQFTTQIATITLPRGAGTAFTPERWAGISLPFGHQQRCSLMQFASPPSIESFILSSFTKWFGHKVLLCSVTIVDIKILAF